MSITTSPEMDKKTGAGVDREAWQTSFMNETFTNLQRFISTPFLAAKMERVRKGVTPREIVYEELLNLMARNDDLVPCSQSEPLNDLVSSADKEKIIWPAGHIGLAVSGRAQKDLWPRAVDWLVQRTD